MTSDIDIAATTNTTLSWIERISSMDLGGYFKALFAFITLATIALTVAVIWYKVTSHNKNSQKKLEFRKSDDVMYELTKESMTTIHKIHDLSESYQNILSKIMGFKSQTKLMRVYSKLISGYIAQCKLVELTNGELGPLLDELSELKDIMAEETIESTLFKLSFEKETIHIGEVDYTIYEYIRHIYATKVFMEKSYEIQSIFKQFIIDIISATVSKNKKVNYVEVQDGQFHK